MALNFLNDGYFAGKVGIGTASPSDTLTVVGDVRVTGILKLASGSAGAPSLAHRSDENTGLFFPANDNIGFTTSNTERMRITSTGVISIGPSTTSSEIYFNYNNTNNKGGLKIDYSTGELRLTAGESGNGYHQAFYTNGSERMRITSTGGMSFGSTGTAYGTSGQVLTSAGNASPTWTTPTTGSVTSINTGGGLDGGRIRRCFYKRITIRF
jgi:hypothetical protein